MIGKFDFFDAMVAQALLGHLRKLRDGGNYPCNFFNRSVVVNADHCRRTQKRLLKPLVVLPDVVVKILTASFVESPDKTGQLIACAWEKPKIF